MIIGIPVYDDVDMLDVTGPFEMFRWAGTDVELIVETAGELRVRKGFAFQVTNRFCEACDYDAL